MFEAMTNTRSRWCTFWPKVNDIAGAEEAIRFATWTTFFVAALELVGGAWTLVTGDETTALTRVGTAVYLGLLALGIRRKWRYAAVIGVAVLVIGVTVQSIGRVEVVGRTFSPRPLAVALLVGFIHGVRGTYAFRRLSAVPRTS